MDRLRTTLPAALAVTMAGLVWVAWFLGSRAAQHGPTGQSLNDIGVGELVAGRCVGQTFVADAAGLYRVDVWLATFVRTNRGPLVLHVRPAWFAADWATVEIDMAVVQDNAYQTFEFEPLALPAGVPAFFCVEAPTASLGNAVTVGGNSTDAYSAGLAMLSTGAPVDGVADLKFQLFYRPGAALAAREVLRQAADGKPGLLANPNLYLWLLAAVSAAFGALGWAFGRLAVRPPANVSTQL
jgi:hypothetical protein